MTSTLSPTSRWQRPNIYATFVAFYLLVCSSVPFWIIYLMPFPANQSGEGGGRAGLGAFFLFMILGGIFAFFGLPSIIAAYWILKKKRDGVFLAMIMVGAWTIIIGLGTGIFVQSLVGSTKSPSSDDYRVPPDSSEYVPIFFIPFHIGAGTLLVLGRNAFKNQ